MMRSSPILLLAILLSAAIPPPAHAEEGGSGHYLPGSMASFVDGVPTGETFIARLNLVSYTGDIDATHAIPVAGLSAFGLEADSFASGLTLLWRPPWEINDCWSYAMSATIPYLWMDVEADVEVPLPGGGLDTVRLSSSVDGIGDIVLMPLMLNYHASPDLNFNFRLAAYAPTGRYQVGRLANTGKNFWTIEPAAAVMYFGQDNGIEASLFFGADFNFENPDTRYRSGTQLRLDGTLAQHFPLWGGLAGAGISGYWYEQVTGDSGSGAGFGDFKGRTAGLGPAFSYTAKLGDTDVIGEIKWLHEFETRNRLEGDYLWAKVVFKF